MPALYAFSPMTDTTEIPMLSGARLAQADTEWIPFPVAFADAPPAAAPAPVPQRLPRRLRRRAAAHLADAFHSSIATRAALLATAVAGFATAIGAA
jgi:hypothetical protein